MELKIYLRILLRKWWIALPALLITLAVTAVLTFTQTPTYTSTATFIVTPAGSFEDIKSFVSGLETLSRRTEIGMTYTEVAVSRLIRRSSVDALELSPDQRKGLSVTSQLLAGTNVLAITAEGSNPAVVRDFTDMVGVQTIDYVHDLYEAFDLIQLDQAVLPDSPIAPNKARNLTLGAAFGLILGVSMAFLSEYLQTPLESVTSLGILDDETGAYNKRYFMQRMGEEMSRARRNKYSLSLAMMNVDQLGVMSTSFSSEARSEALRKVTVFLKQYLREEDVMARLDETVFVFLLPDITEENAKTVMEKLQTRMAWTPFEMKNGVKLNLSSATGVVAYQYNGTRQDEFMAQANRALQQAESGGYGRVSSFLESSSEGE